MIVHCTQSCIQSQEKTQCGSVTWCYSAATAITICMYSIFALYTTGGVVPFLAAMRHQTANARSLKPSRWKDYVLPHVDPHMQCK